MGSPLSSYNDRDFSTISPPHHPMEHIFQIPKYMQSHLSEDYTGPHKPNPTPVSQTTNRHEHRPNTQSDTRENPPCKYSTPSLPKRHKSMHYYIICYNNKFNLIILIDSTETYLSQENPPHDSSSNSSFEGVSLLNISCTNDTYSTLIPQFRSLPQNWSNSTQDSGVWSDLSDSYPGYPLCYPHKPVSKRRLGFSGGTDLTSPVKRSLKSSSPQDTTIVPSTKVTRMRTRKSAGIEEPAITRPEKRPNKRGVKPNVQVKQESRMLLGYNTGMSGSQSLPTVTYSSILSNTDSVGYPDPTIFPSPPRHMPIPDVLPIDSSSLLYPCSSIGDPTASWPHKDIHSSYLVPGLYNTPSPPNFHMDIGYSSNSNFSQNSTKIDTSSQLSEHIHCGPMHSSYFYPPTGPSQETDLWNATPPRSLGPISSHYSSQDPLKPLPISSPPSYISPHITYPSPDSTSTHPFYTPSHLSTSLFQHPGVSVDDTLLSQPMLPDMINTLPPGNST